MATTRRPGRVYLSLPREVLGEHVAHTAAARPPRARPQSAAPVAVNIATLADWIAAARLPLIITSRRPASA